MKRRGGFALLEVLVALAIFMMIIVPLLNLEVASASQVGQVRLQRRAHDVAMAYLDKMLATSVAGDQKDHVDEFDIETHTTDMEQVRFLQRVNVQVFYHPAGGERGEMLEEMAAYRGK